MLFKIIELKLSFNFCANVLNKTASIFRIQMKTISVALKFYLTLFLLVGLWTVPVIYYLHIFFIYADAGTWWFDQNDQMLSDGSYYFKWTLTTVASLIMTKMLQCYEFCPPTVSFLHHSTNQSILWSSICPNYKELLPVFATVVQ